MNTYLLQIANFHQADIQRFVSNEKSLRNLKQAPNRLGISLKNVVALFVTVLR